LAPGVEVFHEALDGAALAGRVPAFEEDDHPLPGFLDPGLELEQLDLQAVLLLLVGLAGHQVLVGVGAFAPAFGEFIVGMGGQLLDGFVFGEQCLAQNVGVVG
jgi:hypothetical protein